IPWAAASAASGPWRVPTYRNSTDASRRRSACATASTGVADPPEPPPASRTLRATPPGRLRGSLHRVARLVARAVGEALEAQLGDAADQLGVRHPAGFPEFGEHADAGEPGHGVDLVQVHPPGAPLEEKVDPRQTAGF